MPSTSTMALIEHELKGNAVLELRVVGTRYPIPADSECVPRAQTPADSKSMQNVNLNTPPGDDRSACLDVIVTSANANANTSGNLSEGDNMTQSGATGANATDGLDPEMEALERELERYVPRTRPSKPAIGAQLTKPPATQNKATNNVSKPPGAKSSRPPAVTATTKTTASRPKK